MPKPAWVLQQLVPPLALSYFIAGWRVCALELGPGRMSRISGQRCIGLAYSAFSTISISCLSILYMRLYFLSPRQSAPPKDPPAAIRDKKIIYECLSPAEAAAVLLARTAERATGDLSPGSRLEETTPLHQVHDTEATNGIGLVNRCHRDRCKGRWKPARARHCSLCRTCRCGFDHHCAIFANCLTAPYIPHFLCLLSLAPMVILVLVSPVLLPVSRRAGAAWAVASSDEGIRRRWWDWKASWVIAGGPVGRWLGGLCLGWKILDRKDGGGSMRLQVGVLAFLGVIISLMCVALVIATISVIRNGHLTVDRERIRSHIRARTAILDLQRAGKPVPQTMVDTMERLADRQWFFVPVPNHPDGGVVLPTLPDEQAYDHGDAGNWEVIMGHSGRWSWLLPWRAVRMGMSMEELCNWPLNPVVGKRLRAEADRMSASQEADAG